MNSHKCGYIQYADDPLNDDLLIHVYIYLVILDAILYKIYAF